MHLPPVRQLQYLVALKAELHFGRAAAAMNVTQSTLSTGIRELERLLGVLLVERTNRSVAFTEAGDIICDRAKTILLQSEDLVAQAASFMDPLARPLRLGVIPTIAPFLMAEFVVRLKRALPSLVIYIRENTTANLITELHENKLDIVLLALPYDTGLLATRIVRREGLHLASHKKSTVTAQTDNFDELPDESLLLLDDGHCLRDHALAGCRLKSQRKIHTFGANSLAMLVQMVNQNLGLTLLPDMALASGVLLNTNISTSPLPVDRFYRDIGFAWRRGHSREPLLQEIMAQLN